MCTSKIMDVIQVALPAMVALLAVKWSYFKVLKIAKEKKLVDSPDARKLQQTPVPVLGGIAVFFGVAAGMLVGTALYPWFHEGSVSGMAAVFCALVLMIYAGGMDDMIGLTPKSRFAIEIFTLLGIIFASGLCVDQLNGLWGVGSISWWEAVPLTVFGGVGIINAVNMIDGVNGLSSGLCISCSILFGLAFLLVGDTMNAMLAFIMAAALVPFLFHNVFGNRSRMFIGDAGTMMMGVVLMWFVIVMLNSDVDLWKQRFGHDVNLIALALAILSVPVLDTIRVMSMRVMQKKSPFHPDKTHLHHVFVKIGISHSITALTEIVLNLLVVGAWILLVCLGTPIDMQLYLVVAIALILVWGTYFWLYRQQEYHTDMMHRLAHISIRTQLGHTQWWQKFEQWLDGPETKMETEVEEKSQPIRTVEEFYHFDTIDPDNLKELDRKRIYGFMKGKVEVYVDDIKMHSGANPLRVDVVIEEGICDGFITIIKENEWKAPMIVARIE